MDAESLNLLGVLLIQSRKLLIVFAARSHCWFVFSFLHPQASQAVLSTAASQPAGPSPYPWEIKSIEQCRSDLWRSSCQTHSQKQGVMSSLDEVVSII